MARPTGPIYSSQTKSDTSGRAKPSGAGPAFEAPPRFWEKEHVSTKRARTETRASAMQFLREREADLLTPEHELRRKALASWARWYMSQPHSNNEFLKTVAEGDPVRRGPPKGWKGVVL